MRSIYKSKEAKAEILNLHAEKLATLSVETECFDIESTYGRTRVLISGQEKSPPIVFFHGVHAGAALTLEAVQNLSRKYRLIIIETVGQAVNSEETRMNLSDSSFAMWAKEILDSMSIRNATFVGISYGAFILQKLITHFPEYVDKVIFIAPSGIQNGNLGTSLRRLTLPLVKFKISQKEAFFDQFVSNFVPKEDLFMRKLMKLLLTKVRMDYRRPILLKEKDVSSFNKAVYLILADDDVFFPTDKVIRRCKEIFPQIGGIEVLENCLHMPSKAHFAEISNIIDKWYESTSSEIVVTK